MIFSIKETLPEFIRKWLYWRIGQPIADQNGLLPRTNHCSRYLPPHADDGELGAFQHLGAVRCVRAN